VIVTPTPEPEIRLNPGWNEVRRADRYGDPLPPGARARIGTIRLKARGRVHGLVFARDGKTFLSLGSQTLPETNTAQLWDARTGRELLAFPVTKRKILPDGQTLASWDEHGQFRFWDMTTAKEVRQVALQGACPPDIDEAAFAADG
jgi:hypothetical protein